MTLLTALFLSASATAGVGECDTQTHSDFDIGRTDGLLVSSASRGVAGETQTRILSGVTVTTRRSDHDLVASARVDVLEGRVEAASFLLGYAEAGTEVSLVVIDPRSWSVLCREDIELEVARYIDVESVYPRSLELACGWSRGYAPDAEDVQIQVEAHTWAGAGGLATAEAELTVQVVDVALEGCSSATCAGSCGGSPDGNCYCDEACASYGDCCGDYSLECVQDSCWERCGGHSGSGVCWCDEFCTEYGDCCGDFGDSCP